MAGTELPDRLYASDPVLFQEVADNADDLVCGIFRNTAPRFFQDMLFGVGKISHPFAEAFDLVKPVLHAPDDTGGFVPQQPQCRLDLEHGLCGRFLGRAGDVFNKANDGVLIGFFQEWIEICGPDLPWQPVDVALKNIQVHNDFRAQPFQSAHLEPERQLVIGKRHGVEGNDPIYDVGVAHSHRHCDCRTATVKQQRHTGQSQFVNEPFQMVGVCLDPVIEIPWFVGEPEAHLVDGNDTVIFPQFVDQLPELNDPEGA